MHARFDCVVDGIGDALGTGTCLMLGLIETFPDQAVRLLQCVGMIKSHDVVYQKGWNRRMLLSMEGMLVQPAKDIQAWLTVFA